MKGVVFMSRIFAYRYTPNVKYHNRLLLFAIVFVLISLLSFLLMLGCEVGYVLHAVFFISPVIIFACYKSYIRTDVLSPYVLFPLAYVAYYSSGLPFWPWYCGLEKHVEPYILELVLIGFTGYLIGLWFANRSNLWKGSDHNAEQIIFSRFWLLVLVYIVVGMISLLFILSKASFKNIDDIVLYRSYVYGGVPGWVGVLANFLRYGIVLLFCYLLRYRVSRVRAFLLYSLIVSLVMSTLLTSSRTLFIHIIAFWIFLRHYLKPKGNTKFRVATFIALILFLIMGLTQWIRYLAIVSPTLRAQRLSLIADRGVDVSNFVSILAYLTFSIARNGVETFARVAYVVPSVIQFQLGKFVGQTFMTLLPGRQDNPPMFVSNVILDRAVRTGYPPTIVGGFYIDFGIPGIFLGMLLCGFLMAKVYQKSQLSGKLLWKVLYVFLLIEMVTSIYGMVLGNIRPVIDLIVFYISFTYISKSERSIQGQSDYEFFR